MSTVTDPDARVAPEAEDAPPPPGPRRRFRLTGSGIAITVVVVLLAYLVLVPLGFLLYRTFFGDAGFTLSGFSRVFALNADTGRLIGNTLLFGLGSVVLSVLIGTGLAYLAERTNVPFRRLLSLSALIPLIVPSILYAPAWIFLASKNVGLLNSPVQAVFGPDAYLFDIYSIPGMIWVQSLHSAPIVYLMMTAAFRAADPSLEEAARVAGIGRWRTFWSVTLPMVRSSLASAVLIIFILAIEVFEVPAMIGLPGGIYVMTSRLYSLYREFPIDYPAVGAIGVALLVLAVIGVALAARIGGSIKQTGSITGKAFRPRREDLGRARPVWGAVVFLYFVIAVVLPIAVLLYASLLHNYQIPSWEALAAMNLDNYRDVFANPAIGRAFGNTIILGLGAATIAMIITVVAAWITVRTKLKGRGLLDALAFSPIVIPGLVFGVALAFVYLRLPIPVYGTLIILLIAYVTRFLPYGMRYAVAAMSSISPELEESAQVSGASWWSRMRRVILPLAAPGLISGWLFIVIVTFRELQSSILIYTPGQEVVSILIFQEFQDGRLSLVAAIGILLVALLVVIVTIAQILGARRGVRVEG